MDPKSHQDDYNGSFRDTVWLQSFPLNYQTVLHYFALSPFYDRSCNNERLKMQRLELDRLKSMRGIEYEALLSPKQHEQGLFLVRKQRRSSPTQIKPLALYYILDGTIYQAPNIHAMLTSRLKKCSFRVNEAFQALAAGVQFGATEGYVWNFSTDKEKSKPIPSEQVLQKLKKRAQEQEKKQSNSARIESIMLHLMKKYIPDVLEAAKQKQNGEGSQGQNVGSVTAGGAAPSAEVSNEQQRGAKRQKTA